MLDTQIELLKRLKKHEGFSATPYKDIKGILTIGFGTNLEEGITEKQAELLLIAHLNTVINELLEKKPFIDKLDVHKKSVLFELAYWIGVPRLLKFKKMFAALERSDFKEAGKELRDSKLYKEFTTRAENLAVVIEN